MLPSTREQRAASMTNKVAARKLDPPTTDLRHREHRGTSTTTEHYPGMIVETKSEVTQAMIRTTVVTTVFRKDVSSSAIGPPAPSPPDKDKGAELLKSVRTA